MSESIGFTGFPSQKKTRVQKTKKWAKQCIDSVDNGNMHDEYGVRNTKKEKYISYQLYNGVVDKRDMEATINPTNLVASYVPEELVHYPIAAPKIDLLVGEESRRRFDFRVVVTNPDAISEKEEKLTEMWKNKIIEIVESKSTSKEEVEQNLKKYESYLKQSWQDIKEKTANNILRHYYNEYNMPLIFNEGFKDVLLAGEEIYQVDVISKEPILKKLNPLRVHTVRSGGSSWIQDSDLIVIEDYWNPGRIIDTFYNDLKPKEIEKLEEQFAGSSTDEHKGAINQEPDVFIPGQEIDDYIGLSNFYGNNYGMPYDTNGNIRVLRVYWKSFRKVKQVKYYDEDGNTQVDIFSESYEIDKDLGEEEKILWINEWWEGTKIGDDIYIQMQPKPIQYNSMDNPSKCNPGIVGLIYNTNQFRSVSVMDRMKQYQYLYDAVKDRVNRAMSKYLGPLLELDLAKIPENWEVDKWLHFAVANGIAVTDSFKEGNKGSATGKLAGGFNTSGKVLNLDMGNYIQNNISFLEYIKSEMGEVVGISKQREGQISNRETVGGVERSVNQSNNITEHLFMKHESVKVEVMKIFLESAKIALKGQSKKIQYILGDDSIEILNLDGDNFLDSDYGILVSINNKYQELNNALKELAHAGIQNDKMDFSTLMDIYMSESLSDIRQKIKQKEEEKQQQIQSSQQEEQKLRQQEIQANQETEQIKLKLEEEKNIRDNQTRIQIAILNAEKNIQNGDVDNDGLSDSFELIKHKDNLELKMKELLQKDKHHNDEMKIKKSNSAIKSKV